MDKFKVVNQNGNDATESQIFGFIAYELMTQALDQLIDKGRAKVAGEEFTITPEALIKLEGIKKHIAERWDKPIEAVKIVKKTASLEWEI